MSYQPKLVYAADDNKRMVYIKDTLKGVNYYCPECGGRLAVKKNGTKLQPHFAHIRNINCNNYGESALHKMAKQVISELKAIWLPEVTNARTGNIIRAEELFNIEHAEIEPHEGSVGFTPDVKLYGEDKQVLVEVYVAHRVDKNKLRRIQDTGIDCIEISLKQVDREISPAELKQFIITQVQNKEWIYNKEHEKSKELYKVRSLNADEIEINNKRLQGACTLCNHGELVLRMNSSNGGKFFGCTSFNEELGVWCRPNIKPSMMYCPDCNSMLQLDKNTEQLIPGRSRYYLRCTDEGGQGCKYIKHITLNNTIEKE
mgnify:FL=1